MARFESLKLVPAETRTILRERFSRHLLEYRQARPPKQAEELFDDELVLKLFQHLEIVSNDSPERAEDLYNELRSTDHEAPALENLISEGWVVRGWHCLSVPRDIGLTVLREQAAHSSSFVAWRKALYEPEYSVRPILNADAKLVELAETVTNRSRVPAHIVCSTPSWVAARLWDRDERHETGDPGFLFECLQAWELLNPAALIPSEAWAEDARKHFETAALAALENDANPLSWSEYRQRGVLQLARTRGGDNNRFASFLPQVPDTLVARGVWLVDQRMEFLRFDNGAWRHAARLITLLLSEVEHCEHAQAPHPIASRVLDLAMEHPEVLSTLLFFIDWRPTLLADMVLKPETSALACLLISKWRTASGAWDRQMTARDNEAARSVAFVDALAVMCHHVQSTQLRPAEVAALFYELHMRLANGDSSAPTGNVMLAALRSELVGFPRPMLVSIFDALVSGAYSIEVGLPAFSAALDLVEVGQLITDVDCSPLVDAYAESIRQPNYQLSAAQISPEGAALLFEMSEQLGSESLSAFLAPIDVKERLASSVSADENPYIVEQELARSFRAHMRVLARAIIGQRARVPQPLIKAFAEAISSAAVTDSDKGRIAAFAVRFERPPTGRTREAGLAEDFGNALRCVSDYDGARLLEKILEIGEPAFLAQLCASAPAPMRSAIRERIRKLGPSHADAAWHYTDLHNRIDELLAIGEYTTAKAYIDSEPESPKPLAGRFAVIRLRHRLQLALAMEDWKTLDSATVPADIQQLDANAARDTILFYNAVAQFSREGGDIENAERAFDVLHVRHRAVPEYGFNLFAAKLGRLVKEQPFSTLQGQDSVQARELLLEAERMEPAYDLTVPSADSYLGNKAILLLALGRTREAAELLRRIFLTRMTDRIGAYLSVALARLGRTHDALSTLDVAEESLGTSDLLRMARVHLTEGRPMVRVPLFYAINADGSSSPTADLDSNDNSRWLWFHPTVIESVIDRFSGQLSWYTRDTGAIACSSDYLIPFGVNNAGLVNVFDSDIAKLDIFQQRVWSGHSVTPDGTVAGELLILRARAEAVDTVAPEQRFFDARIRLNQLTVQWYGSELFKKHDSESAILKHIHRFRALDEASLLGLAKDITRVTADMIDIGPLREVKQPPPTKWGSLKQLEMALSTVIDAESARSALTRLVGVYELRLGDAHPPSSRIERGFELVGLDRQASLIRQAFEMIDAAASSLEHMCEIIANRPPID